MRAPSPISAYRIDGDAIVPTGHARGPWYGDQQHGASLLGLLARAFERVPSPGPMRLTRITADLSRPVPMVPFAISAEPLRAGRRVQSLAAEVSVDGRVLGRATATRIRVAEGLVAAACVPLPFPEDAAPPLPEEGRDVLPRDVPSFHDLLEVRGEESDPARVRRWFRMAHPLVAGEAPSPTVRLASVADMIASCGEFLGSDWISINPEVTLQIERLPAGEWLCTESRVRFGTDGIGMSEGVLYDRTGRVGRSAKSILNDPR